MKLDLKKLVLAGTFLFSGMFLSSCLNDDVGSGISDQSGLMVFINASPGTNGLKFYADNNPIYMPSLDYNQYYGYVYQRIGNTDFTARTGGTNLDTLSLNIELDQFYSMFAVNTAENLELVAYEDNIPSISGSSKNLIRFIHLSHNAPSVKVGIEGINENLGTYHYKQASSFLETNRVFNKKLFLLNAETNDTIFTKNITLNDGRAYTIFSEGIYESENEDQDLDVQLLLY